MEVGQYYITTLTNAAEKLGPIVIYGLLGYLIFIKLPFLFFYKSLKKNTVEIKQEDFSGEIHFQKKMEEERIKEFNERMKNLGGRGENKSTKEEKAESHSKSSEENNRRSQERRKKQDNSTGGERRKEERRENSSKDKQQTKKTTEKSHVIEATPEEILFDLKSGEKYSSLILKKKYHQLLQENHPDKFRTDHQKEFAEAKTKNINDAYQKLKKRVTS